MELDDENFWWCIIASHQCFIDSSQFALVQTPYVCYYVTPAQLVTNNFQQVGKKDGSLLVGRAICEANVRKSYISKSFLPAVSYTWMSSFKLKFRRCEFAKSSPLNSVKRYTELGDMFIIMNCSSKEQ